MGDTYDTAAEAEADRDQQRSLLAALNAWHRALRKDECNAWCISGKGHNRVYTWGDGKSGCFTSGADRHDQHCRSLCILDGLQHLEPDGLQRLADNANIVGETDASPVSYRAPLRQALIDDNPGYVSVVVCAADYAALKRGIEHLAPPPQ